MTDRRVWSIFLALVVLTTLVGLFVHGPTELVNEAWVLQWHPEPEQGTLEQIRETIGDEWVHLIQILRFRSGDWTLDPSLSLPMPPGYHAAVAVISNVFNIEGVAGYRLVSTLFFLPAPLLIFALLNRLSPQQRLIRGVQFLLIPAIFPYIYLIYTDGLSLTLVLSAVYFMERRCLWAAGLAGAASICVRQNNVVFLVMLQAMVFVRDHGWKLSLQNISDNIVKCWMLVLVAIGLGIWIVKKGAVSGDADTHPGGVHTENIFAFLFMTATVLCPMHLVHLGRLWRHATTRPWTALFFGVVGFLIFYSLFLLTFRADNEFEYSMQHMLLNRVSLSAARSDLYGFIFTALAFCAGTSLVLTQWRDRACFLLLPTILLFLAPTWLIHVRYGLIPFALIILYRNPLSMKIEVAIAVLLGLMTVIAIATGWS